MSLRINLDYEKMLPRMTQEEFAQLKKSIQEEGQHYPIVANEDLEVLDGHHRFRACTELGLEPDFEVRKFEDKLLEKKFVIEANLMRRHLNNFQLVELAVPLLEIEKALAKKRKVDGGKRARNLQLGLAPNDADPYEPIFKGKTAEIVAKRVGLSTRTLERGKKILEEASEEEKEKLREGKASIAKIYSELTVPKNHATPERSKSTTVAEDPRFTQNEAALLALLKILDETQLFCPSCGSKLFECSGCHKALKDLLKR